MRLEAVIKIGGSLAKTSSLNGLCKFLEKLSKTHKYLIVPGGSEFSDVVEKFDKKFHLSNQLSHKMAILAMDQYGLLLSNLMNGFLLDEIKVPEHYPKKPVIFLASNYMFTEDPLPNSWDVTSDSIAAHVAQKLKATMFILVKDVDGIFSFDPKKKSDAELIRKISATELLQLNKKTCVDKYLPQVLLERKIKCYVVNGKYPERIDDIFKGKETICTEIF
jgi:hypothetical protein